MKKFVSDTKSVYLGANKYGIIKLVFIVQSPANNDNITYSPFKNIHFTIWTNEQYLLYLFLPASPMSHTYTALLELYYQRWWTWIYLQYSILYFESREKGKIMYEKTFLQHSKVWLRYIFININNNLLENLDSIMFVGQNYVTIFRLVASLIIEILV